MSFLDVFQDPQRRNLFMRGVSVVAGSLFNIINAMWMIIDDWRDFVEFLRTGRLVEEYHPTPYHHWIWGLILLVSSLLTLGWGIWLIISALRGEE